jgi:hypothetical protein
MQKFNEKTNEFQASLLPHAAGRPARGALAGLGKATRSPRCEARRRRRGARDDPPCIPSPNAARLPAHRPQLPP